MPTSAWTPCAKRSSTPSKKRTSTGTTLLRDGFVYNMIVQHEAQHNETMLQTLQLKEAKAINQNLASSSRRAKRPRGEMVPIPGGEFVMGTDDRAVALDNERNAHVVDLPDFLIDATPVTNKAFAEFVEDGATSRALGRKEAGSTSKRSITEPKHWYQPEPHSWWTERFGFDEPLNFAAPVVHVSWYEAVLTPGGPASASRRKRSERRRPLGTRRRGPEALSVGRRAAHVRARQPGPVGLPAGGGWGVPRRGERVYGVLGMIGDVWEWTASVTLRLPGLRSLPLPGVLRDLLRPRLQSPCGGSWATRPSAIRNTFRNWDYPIRRQLFAGFRCAKDG